jgi:hypothetical protein
MKWRVVVELSGADGTVRLHEVSVGGCTTTTCSPDTLGLTLATGKETLAGLQRHLVQAQTEEHCRSRRRCQRCGRQRPLKDTRDRVAWIVRLVPATRQGRRRFPSPFAGCSPCRSKPMPLAATTSRGSGTG